MRARRGGGRRAADPGVPVPADRSAGRRRQDRPRRQRQEGPVPRALGHGERGAEAHRRRQPQRAGHRARRLVRLQHAGLRHARAADHGARDRRAGDLRRHPFGAAAGRAGHVVGRRARIRAGAGARRGRGRRRRRVHRDASGSGQGAVRRAEHDRAQGHGRAAAHAAGVRPASPNRRAADVRRDRSGGHDGSAIACRVAGVSSLFLHFDGRGHRLPVDLHADHRARRIRSADQERSGRGDFAWPEHARLRAAGGERGGACLRRARLHHLEPDRAVRAGHRLLRRAHSGAEHVAAHRRGRTRRRRSGWALPR